MWHYIACVELEKLGSHATVRYCNDTVFGVNCCDAAVYRPSRSCPI